MGKINVGKLLAGGVAAGIVMNVFDYVINEVIMKSDYMAVFQARSIDPTLISIPTMVVLDFAMALLLVFTYAAIRTRFGPGPKTAVVAGLMVALICNVLAAYFAGQGFFPWAVWAKASVFATANFVVAALVGGALYSE